MCLLTRVDNTIKKYGLLNNKDKVLIGVSGGPDSLVLLDILKRLQNKYNLSLHIAHLDHKLRGEASRQDARFVKRIAKKLELPITVKACNVVGYQKQKGLSLEDAARQLRYQFFFSLMEDLDFKKVAVGHHANDQAETILMKFLRGAGLKGLGGIKPKYEGVIRPLIDLTREEIETYCQKYNLDPRIDQSNFDSKYLRNKIRHNLIPFLIKEYNNNLVDNLNHTANLLRSEEEFLQKHIIKELEKLIIKQSEDSLILDRVEFLQLHIAIQRRIIREAFKRLRGNYKNLYYKHIELALELIKSGETGSKIDLPEEIDLKLNYNQIVITQEECSNKDYFEYELTLGRNILSELNLIINAKVVKKDYNWKSLLSKPQIACFDFEKIGNEFKLRQRRDGDRFYPLGMVGSKKVKDFFIDQKISLKKRDLVPIFTTIEDKIFWLGGLRVDNRFKIEEGTEEILIISMKKSKEEL